jgi:hypothetical protein
MEDGNHDLPIYKAARQATDPSILKELLNAGAAYHRIINFKHKNPVLREHEAKLFGAFHEARTSVLK